MSRLAAVPILALAIPLLGASACSQSILHSGEGVFCSSASNDDPFYGCDDDAPLCVSTDSIPSHTNVETPVYVCRKGCSGIGGACPTPTDVCCPATRYPTSSSPTFACTPPVKCTGYSPPDGGARLPDAGAQTPDSGAPTPDANQPARDATDLAPDAPVSLDATTDA